MEWPQVPDAGPQDPEAAIEGEAWCLRCDQQTGYRLEKVEFLGNPVKSSFFCIQCGTRIHPQGSDRKSARRLRGSGLRLRAGAAISFVLILLAPVLIVLLVVYFLWSLF